MKITDQTSRQTIDYATHVVDEDVAPTCSISTPQNADPTSSPDGSAEASEPAQSSKRRRTLKDIADAERRRLDKSLSLYKMPDDVPPSSGPVQPQTKRLRISAPQPETAEH